MIQRNRADNNFADTEVEELVAMLREAESLEEQGDILQYLVDTQGLDFNTGMLEEIKKIDYSRNVRIHTVKNLHFHLIKAFFFYDSSPVFIIISL